MNTVQASPIIGFIDLDRATGLLEPLHLRAQLYVICGLASCCCSYSLTERQDDAWDLCLQAQAPDKTWSRHLNNTWNVPLDLDCYHKWRVGKAYAVLQDTYQN